MYTLIGLLLLGSAQAQVQEGTEDTSTEDTGTEDTGTEDTGTDTGADSGGGDSTQEDSTADTAPGEDDDEAEDEEATDDTAFIAGDGAAALAKDDGGCAGLESLAALGVLGLGLRRRR